MSEALELVDCGAVTTLCGWKTCLWFHVHVVTLVNDIFGNNLRLWTNFKEVSLWLKDVQLTIWIHLGGEVKTEQCLALSLHHRCDPNERSSVEFSCKQTGHCVVYIHACLRAVVFFPAFVGTLLHLFAHYCHQLSVSVIAWNGQQECVSHCLRDAHMHARPRACARYKQNRDPLVKTWLHSAASGQKLHTGPFRDHLL